MNLLLDTHAFLWFANGDSRLSMPAKTAIDDLANQRHLSMASLWEIAIKLSTGKLKLHVPLEDLISAHVAPNAILLLPIRPEHVAGVIHLPYQHRDPFDRMLVAQATVESMTLVSADPIFDAYGIQRLW